LFAAEIRGGTRKKRAPQNRALNFSISDVIYMDETKQFKCLTDLREIISELDGFYARPSVRGQHPTLYPEVSDGKNKQDSQSMKKIFEL
jgi:hypothetical protein